MSGCGELDFALGDEHGPAWPLIAFATASCIAAVYRTGRPFLQFIATATFVVVAAHHLDAAKPWASGVAPGE